MWPFKKKKNKSEDIPPAFTSIICIPGHWEKWEQFITDLVHSTKGEYIAAGYVITNTKNKKHWFIEFCEHDEKMKKAFETAGKVTMVSKSFLDEIEQHKSVIYISGKTGNMEDALEIARASAAILQSGGIGIKVETAGKAFEKEPWLRECDCSEPRLHELFVVDSIITEDGTVFSCGMQNLGLKDTVISGEGFQFSNDMIRSVNYYMIVDKPVILSGQTFSKDANSPRFRITDEPEQPYKDDERFANPFGMWRLTRIN